MYSSESTQRSHIHFTCSLVYVPVAFIQNIGACWAQLFCGAITVPVGHTSCKKTHKKLAFTDHTKSIIGIPKKTHHFLYRSHTEPSSKMTYQRFAFLLLWTSLLVAPSASFGVSRATAGRSADASSFSRAKPTVFAVDVGSHLSYRNDKEDENSPFVSNSVAIARPRAAPRLLLDPRELPKHSPSPETLKEQKLLMDMEIVIGRFFMIAALVFFAGEIASGLSITDQLTGIF